MTDCFKHDYSWLNHFSKKINNSRKFLKRRFDEKTKSTERKFDFQFFVAKFKMIFRSSKCFSKLIAVFLNAVLNQSFWILRIEIKYWTFVFEICSGLNQFYPVYCHFISKKLVRFWADYCNFLNIMKFANLTMLSKFYKSSMRTCITWLTRVTWQKWKTNEIKCSKYI